MRLALPAGQCASLCEREKGIEPSTVSRLLPCVYESAKIQECVDRAVKWSIPEFQRGFVWKATQVRDHAESLWLDYPIGSLLLWNSQKLTEERIVRDAQRPTLCVVDGQRG